MTDNSTSGDEKQAVDQNDSLSIDENERFDYMCTVCGTELDAAVVECDLCRRRFHKECWEYCAACPAIGCGSLGFKTVLSGEYVGNLDPDKGQLVSADGENAVDMAVDDEVMYIGSSEGENSPVVIDDPDVIVLDGAVASLIKLYSAPGNKFVDTFLYLFSEDQKHMEGGLLAAMFSGKGLYTTSRALMFAFCAPLMIYLVSNGLVASAATMALLYLFSIKIFEPIAKSLGGKAQTPQLSHSGQNKATDGVLFIGSGDASSNRAKGSKKGKKRRSERLKKHRKTRQ